MTEQEGERSLAAPGLATGDLTAEEDSPGRRVGSVDSTAPPRSPRSGTWSTCTGAREARACSSRPALRRPPRRTTLPDGSAWSAPTATRSKAARPGTTVLAHDGIHQPRRLRDVPGDRWGRSNPAARREIASLADLLGAIRLPGGAHQRAAGTGVITDLLLLRRREPGRPPDAAAWEQTRYADLDGVQVPVNEYFLDHPDAVLGQMGAVHGAYRSDDLVVRPDGDTIAAFSAALDALISPARQRGLAYRPADQARGHPVL